MMLDTSENILKDIDALCELGPDSLSQMGAAILLATNQGLATDSRDFAKKFDLAHAMVIRECAILADELGLIKISKRDERTMRTYYNVTEQGMGLLEKLR